MKMKICLSKLKWLLVSVPQKTTQELFSEQTVSDKWQMEVHDGVLCTLYRQLTVEL